MQEYRHHLFCHIANDKGSVCSGLHRMSYYDIWKHSNVIFRMSCPIWQRIGKGYHCLIWAKLSATRRKTVILPFVWHKRKSKSGLSNGASFTSVIPILPQNQGRLCPQTTFFKLQSNSWLYSVSHCMFLCGPFGGRVLQFYLSFHSFSEY